MHHHPNRQLGRTAFWCITGACLAACSRSEPPAATTVPSAHAATKAPQPSSSAVALSRPEDAGPPAAEPIDAGPPPYEGPWLAATAMHALVLSEMEWPTSEGSKRQSSSAKLGYLRHGSKAPVIAEPHKKSNCAEGWYELVAGGFVCGRYATTQVNHPRVKGTRGPDLAAALPYTYGINATHGVPLYRQVPSREERIKAEPWLKRPKRAKVAPEDENPYEADASVARTGDPEEPEKPWYLRDLDGGAQPQLTMEELRGEGILARRMVKGFFLSIDKSFSANGTTWWKTNDGLVAPGDQVYLTKPATEFHGVWLGDEGTFITHPGGQPRKIEKLPVGFVTSRTARKWTIGPDRKRAAGGGALHRFTTVGLTGQVVTISGTEYAETDEGWWLRALDGTRTEPGPPPDKLGADEKWIDVNLKRQTLVAFVGDKPVFATIVSSGRQGHDTPPGSFRIREKHVASTMDGDAEGPSDGPYSIQDVPYIQYFSGSYALHGAFWHAEFGRVKSHGCVNLAPWDARALFGWTEPQLPEGWHGVNATSGKPGTRVILH